MIQNYDIDTVRVTTDADGDGTANSRILDGEIVSILYDGNLATTVDVTAAGATSGLTYWSESNLASASTSRSPAQLQHSTAGTSASQYTSFMLAGEPVQFTVAQGGNTQTADFTILAKGKFARDT